jgi:hypothetical protein
MREFKKLGLFARTVGKVVSETEKLRLFPEHGEVVENDGRPFNLYMEGN